MVLVQLILILLGAASTAMALQYQVTPAPTEPTSIAGGMCPHEVVVAGGDPVEIKMPTDVYVSDTCPCPEGEEITDPADCAAAACFLHEEWNVMKSDNQWPHHVKGCTKRSGPVDFGFWFNEDPTGACDAHGWVKSVCKKRKPNILLLTYDGWRWDFDGTHPEIDMRGTAVKRVMEQGVRFDKAYIPAAVCAPSRSAVALAMDYDVSPVTGNGMAVPLEMDTYFERLQKAGYFTIMTGKDHIRGHDPGPGPDGTNVMAEMGWDACLGTDDVWEFAKTGVPEEPYGFWLEEQGVFEGMSEEYGGFPFKSVPVPQMGALVPTVSSLCYNDDWMGDLMLGASNYCPNRSSYTDEYRYDKWMLDVSKQVFQDQYLANSEAIKKPWMWLVNFNGGHPPWIMTTKAWEDTADRVFPAPRNAPEFAKNPEIANFLRKSYAALLEDTDAMSNGLMDWLDENSPGGLANMVVILTADHGEMLGDHDRTRKQTQHEASCRVPVAMMGPGINARNKVIKTPVSTVDVPGTIMAIAGATPADTMTAKSLLPLIESDVPSREIVEAGLTFRAVDIRMRWKQYNDTHTLKLYCCPIGCPKSTSTPDSPGQAQAGLVLVNDEGDGEDVTAQGHAEAAELLGTLTQNYQDACGPLVI